MNAFDMISEPLLFAEQLCDHIEKVHRSVEMARPLADAFLAGDGEKIASLQEQVSGIGDELDRIKLALYTQVKHMYFHRANEPAVSQYLAFQDDVVDALHEFADLLALRKTPILAELHANLRTSVAQVVSVSHRALGLKDRLSPETLTACSDTAAPSVLDIIRQVHEENGRLRQMDVDFARHVHSLEGQLDPATILFLDKCRAALRKLAGGTEHAADCLYLMIGHA